MRFLKGLVLTTENRGPTALWDGKAGAEVLAQALAPGKLHDIAGNHLGCILLKMPAMSLWTGPAQYKLVGFFETAAASMGMGLQQHAAGSKDNLLLRLSVPLATELRGLANPDAPAHRMLVEKASLLAAANLVTFGKAQTGKLAGGAATRAIELLQAL